MSKTKFTKVAEQLPGKQYVFLTPSIMTNKPEEKEFIEPFWAEESPDREDEMREMLEECKLQLEHLNSSQERGTTNSVLSKLNSLLQSLKQEK